MSWWHTRPYKKLLRAESSDNDQMEKIRNSPISWGNLTTWTQRGRVVRKHVCVFVCIHLFIHVFCASVSVGPCFWVAACLFVYVCVRMYECLCLCLCVSLLIPKKGEWTNVSQIPKTPPHSCQNRSGCLSIHSHSEHAQGNFGKCGAPLHEYFEYFVAIFCSEIIVLHEYLQTEYLSAQRSLVWSSFTWS